MRTECVAHESAADGETAAKLGLPQRFEVTDRPSAEWVVRKLVEAGAHICRVQHQADREVRRTERERDFLLRRFGPQLERWTREQLEQIKGRRKSVLLLGGTVGFRTVAAKLVVEDPAAAIAWAKRHCRSAVAMIEKLAKTPLTAHVGRRASCQPARGWSRPANGSTSSNSTRLLYEGACHDCDDSRN